jgi:hypothetical protein
MYVHIMLNCSIGTNWQLENKEEIKGHSKRCHSCRCQMSVEVTIDSDAGDGAAMIDALARELGVPNPADRKSPLHILPADGDDVAATIGRTMAWIFVNRPHHVACSVRIGGSSAEAVRFER